MTEITEVCTQYSGALSMISWELIKLEQLPEIKVFYYYYYFNKQNNFVPNILTT